MKAQEQDPAVRALWWRHVQSLDARQLVFLDECGINTVLGALSCQGVQAVMSLQGATDTLAFEAFIEQVLVPTLVPGQIVVLDNLSAHKSLKAQKLVEKAHCSWLFLPPYSPDFNPIEMLWSKFKSDLRREGPRQQEQLDELIWPLLSTATPKHAHN